MAIEFDNGDPSYASSDSTYDPPAEGTIAFWFYWTAGSFTSTWRPMGFADAFELRGVSSGVLYNEFYYAGSGGVGTPALSVQTWYHFAFTWDWDGVDVENKNYVNGVIDGTQTDTGADPGSGTMRVAASRDAISNPCDMIIDDLRCYHRVLADEEIESIWACEGTDYNLDGLAHWFRFLEAADGTAATGAGALKNEIPTGWDMTPTNSPTWWESQLSVTRMRA